MANHGPHCGCSSCLEDFPATPSCPNCAVLAARIERLKAEADRLRMCFDEPMETMADLRAERDRLRKALVGLVGVDTGPELDAMEVFMRITPAPDEDKVATIDAIHVLKATRGDGNG